MKAGGITKRQRHPMKDFAAARREMEMGSMGGRQHWTKFIQQKVHTDERHRRVNTNALRLRAACNGFTPGHI
jgi:hypothetical protein